LPARAPRQPPPSRSGMVRQGPSPGSDVGPRIHPAPIPAARRGSGLRCSAVHSGSGACLLAFPGPRIARPRNSRRQHGGRSSTLTAGIPSLPLSSRYRGGCATRSDRPLDTRSVARSPSRHDIQSKTMAVKDDGSPMANDCHVSDGAIVGNRSGCCPNYTILIATITLSRTRRPLPMAVNWPMIG